MQTRPVYEDELTRRREENLARFVADNFGLYGLLEPPSLMRCPRFYSADWMLVNDDSIVEVLLECKVRSASFSTYMISLHKAASITHMAAYVGARPLLAVFWEAEGQVGIADLLQCERVCRPGGRKDRGDDQDFEPMVHIPMADFRMAKVDRII